MTSNNHAAAEAWYEKVREGELEATAQTMCYAPTTGFRFYGESRKTKLMGINAVKEWARAHHEAEVATSSPNCMVRTYVLWSGEADGKRLNEGMELDSVGTGEPAPKPTVEEMRNALLG